MDLVRCLLHANLTQHRVATIRLVIAGLVSRYRSH